MSDKANAMRHGHDLWQRVFKEVASEYPQIESSHLYVDVFGHGVGAVSKRFEVIVTNNLFGDIVTDLGAILQGESDWLAVEISILAESACLNRFMGRPQTSPVKEWRIHWRRY